MPRKFSFDISGLVVNKRSRRESDALLDSPPQTPKSVRPPLPEDVEAALRAVCAQVFNESNAASLPDVDHDMITQFWQQNDDKSSAVAESQRAATRPQRSDSLVPQTDPTPDVVRPVQITIKARERSSSQPFLTASIPKTVHRRKPSVQPRGDSIDTMNSVTCSEDTDGPLDPSTAMTSAVLTPARTSKRTSAQAFSSEERPYRPSGLQSRQDSREGTYMNPLGQNPPRTQAATGMRQAGQTARATSAEDNSTQAQQNDVAAPRQRAATYDAPPQAEERNGRSTFRSRAASRARSLSRGIRDFIRPSSRRDHANEPEERVLHSANAARRDHSRPGTASGMRKPSLEFFKRGRRASRENLYSHNLDNSSKTDLSGYESDGRRGRNLKNLNIATGKRRRGAQDEPSQQKPCVDLNRELPPLPSLGLWQDDAQQTTEYRASPESFHHQSATTPMTETTAIVAPLNISPKRDLTTRSTELEIMTETDSTYYTAAGMSDGRVSPPPTMPKTPTSPPPKMSATAGPGDFDMYEPMYVPSPLSGSSLKDVAIESPRGKLALRTSTLSIDIDDILESPVVVDAKRLSRMSVPETRAQLVHNRNPSTHSGRHVPLDRSASADNVPTLPSIAQLAQLDRVSLDQRRPFGEQSVRASMDERPRLFEQSAKASLDGPPRLDEPPVRASTDIRIDSRTGLVMYGECRTPQNDSKVDIHDRLRTGRHYSRPSVNEALDTARTDAVTIPIIPATPNAMMMLKKMAKKQWWKNAKGKKVDGWPYDGNDTQGSSKIFMKDAGDHDAARLGNGSFNVVSAAAPVVRLS